MTFDLKTKFICQTILFPYFSIFFSLWFLLRENHHFQKHITIPSVCRDRCYRKIAEFHKSTAGGCRKLKICVPSLTLCLFLSISFNFYLFRFLHFSASTFLFLSLRPPSMLVNEIANFRVTFTGFPVVLSKTRVTCLLYGPDDMTNFTDWPSIRLFYLRTLSFTLSFHHTFYRGNKMLKDQLFSSIKAI